MKKLSILLTAIMLSFAPTINAQDLWSIMLNSDLNYNEKKTEAEQFIENANSSGDSIDAAALKRYDRWQMFWNNRVDENGDAAVYINNVKSYYEKNASSSEETVWESIGPDIVFSSTGSEVMYTGQVSALEVVIKGNDTIIYAGSKSAGLWKSSNGGITYKNITPNFIGGIRRISVHPVHKDTLIIATGLLRGETMMQQGEYGTGLYRSYDGGETWDNVLPVEISDNTLFVEVQYNIQNPETIFAASFHNFYQSNNGGDSWTEYPLNLTAYSIRKLQHNPLNSSQVMLGGYDILYRRKSDGTFENILSTMLPFIPDETEDNMRIRTEVSTYGNSFYVLLFYRDNDTNSEYRKFLSSDDYGTSWNMLWSGPNIYARMYVATVEMSPDGRFFGGGVTFGKSNHDFTEFYSRHSGLHADIRDICFPDPNNSDLVYAATDGGIGKSTDAAENWENISGDLALNEIYTFSIAESKPNLMLFGSADCGITKRDVVGDWFHVYGGDGGATHISSVNPDTMLQRGNYGLRYSHDGGDNSGEWHSTGLPYPGGYYDPPIIEDPEYSEIFYAALNSKILKSIDGGKTFDQANPFASKGRMVTAMDFSKTNPDVFYFSAIEWSDSDTKITFTKDKGLTWEYFNIGALAGQNGNPLKVTDIKVNDINEDLVWVSIGNMHDGKKVYQTVDGGYSWTNISHNLDNLPVNAIEYDYENDILFLGNDAGIFYLTEAETINSDQTWELYGDFPKFIVTDIKVNHSTNELYASTFGTGMWKVDLSCVNAGGTKQISGTEVWEGEKLIVQNLELLQGAQLTIKGESGIAQDAKITINPGAKLIIDGGTLTNKCGGIWQGIVVKGNKYQSQFPESNQGVLEIKNGGLVEHARRAVYVGNPDAPWDNTAGGIVKISGAVFRDNIACVEIPSYRNGLANNRSYIVNSTFETTDFLASVGEHPWAFISLWNVGIININGNTFINQNPDSYAFNERGKGLKSSDADFYLKPLLTFPGPGLIKNHFENLYKAVETENTGLLSVCDIDNNEFVNNYYSVYVNSVDNANIVSNTFNADWQYAELYLTQSNGFHIENNDFNGQADGYGIWISNSPGENEIYRNRFNNNEYGIITMYDNTSLIGGLQLLCNTFTDNLQHIRVINPPGISNNQGSESLSAGNQFYPECNNGTSDIDNGGNQINYFAERGLEYEPLCNTNVNIFKAEHNTCPSKLNNQIPPGQITTLSDSINTVKTELAIVTDGGDTEGTTEDVENAEPDEALKLRNTLLEKSPNLSDTVMVSSTSVEDVLPSIMVKQVLASNPGAAKSDHVQNALDNRQNQLPQYMRDEINLGKDSLSHKEKLESKLSAFKNKRENLINRKITRLLLDTTEQSLDTIENLLSSENSLHRVYQLVNFYISLNRIQDAQTLFADIPQNFDLSNTQQTEYEKNAQFYTVKFALKNAEKSWFEMSNEQKLLIHTLADDSTTNAGMQARAVLSLIENKDYGYPIPDIEEGGNKNANPDPENLPETFSVYPETAKDYFIIEYALAEKVNPKDIQIAVYDNFGNEIQDFEVNIPANQFLIECENWKTGTYWCRKLNKGKVLAQERINIGKQNAKTESDKGTTGIREPKNNSLFELYPNPAKDYFFVNCNLKELKMKYAKIQILDAKGSVIQEIKLNKAENHIKISTASLKSGMYSVCLKSNGNVIETKTIVVK